MKSVVLVVLFCGASVMAAGVSSGQAGQLGQLLNSIQKKSAAANDKGNCAECTAAERAGVLPQKTDGCTFAALTDQCKLFTSNPSPKIEMPDGTFIPNYSVLLDADALKAKMNSPNAQKAFMDGITQNSRTLLDFSQGLGEINGPSAIFKQELTRDLNSDASYVPQVFQSSISTGQGSARVGVPWPPDDPNASFHSVPVGALHDYLQQVASPQQLAGLNQISRRYLLRDAEMAGAKSLFSDPTFKEMVEITPERQKHVEALAESVRAEIVEQIRQGRPDSELSVNEKNAIKSVETIRPVGIQDLDLQRSPTCNQPVTNAYYDPSRHTINICRNFYNFPDATIVSVLGHEMTHSIDPCSVQFPHYTIDAGKLAQFHDPQSGLVIPSIAGDEDKMRALETIEALAENTSLTAYPFTLTGVSTKALEYFEKLGVITKVLDGDAELKNYVLGDVYSCLPTAKGGGFRSSVDARQLDKIADAVVDQEAKNSLGPFDKAARKKEIAGAFQRFPECVSPGAHSQMGEAMADWMGGQVLGTFLQGKLKMPDGTAATAKMDTPAERLAPIAFFGSLECSQLHNVQEVRTGKDRGPAAVIGEVLSEYAQIVGDPHPDDKDRVDNIYLQNPQVRQALGCAPDAKGCRHKGQTK